MSGLVQKQRCKEAEEVSWMRDGLAGLGAEPKLHLNIVGTVICGSAALALEVDVGTQMDTCFFRFHGREQIGVHTAHEH